MIGEQRGEVVVSYAPGLFPVCAHTLVQDQRSNPGIESLQRMEKRIDFAFRCHKRFSRVSILPALFLIAPDGPIVKDKVPPHASSVLCAGQLSYNAQFFWISRNFP